MERSKEGSDGWGWLFVAGITQRLGRGHQSVVKGEGGGFGPAAGVGLAVDIRDMPQGGAPSSLAPAPQHLGSTGLGIGSQLLSGARLPDARFPHQHDHPTLSGESII